jgi:uncharacterized cupin superfamily protein
MAGYTIKNLKADVDDQAPNFGMSPQMEMRMARVPLEMQNAGISYQRLAPNFRLPFGHNHNQQEEVYVVLSGTLRAKVADEVRSFEAGPEGAEVIAVGAPNTGPGDANVEQGWWSD